MPLYRVLGSFWLFATLVTAQDADDILKHYVAAAKIHDKQTEQYTFTEDVTHFSYDKHGEAKKDGTETHDVIFVEGDTYKKLVARNGAKLSLKEQANEEKKLQQTAEQRRKQRRNGLFHRTVEGPHDDELLTIFDSKYIGEEQVRGHAVWVLELTPKPDHRPVNAHEKDAMSFRKKLWIDQTEYAALRESNTVVGTQTILKPGTVISADNDKINDDAWVPISVTMDYRVQFLKFLNGSGRDEYTYSNYRKFDVQSTITADGVY